jgi:hypothetical protein
MKHETSCGCKKCGNVRKKILQTRESFNSELDVMGIFEAHKFQKAKPFKVTFNEGLDVIWGKESLQEKKLTPRDKMQKEKMVMKLKKKDAMKDLKKKYGKRAKAVAYAIATKHAKETP